jgi:glycosyltransferase involved in cell wall biosynthesis
MRVGVDARLMHFQPAGISRYTWHLLQAMAELDKDDEFIIFQHRDQRTPLITQANFQRRTLFAPAHHRLEQFVLAAELYLHPLDVLHFTDFIPPLHRPPRFYAPYRTVITVHDLAFLHYPHFLTATSAAYYGQIDKAVVRADHIIVPSEHTRRDLIAQTGAPADKVSVIYEAANPCFKPLPPEPTRAEITARYNLPERFVLFVGTIEPRKNLGGLLHAFQYLRQKYDAPDLGLVVAGGQGWLYEETLELVKTLDLEDATFFLGRVPDDDLHKLYVAARCLVHPALYEGFGLPPLEAMACGTPTVVSNVSSLPEVVGDAGLLVDPRNPEEMAIAIHRLTTDDALHAELRAKGLQRAQTFSWEKAARKTLDVYRKVAAPRDVATATAARGKPTTSTSEHKA